MVEDITPKVVNKIKKVYYEKHHYKKYFVKTKTPEVVNKLKKECEEKIKEQKVHTLKIKEELSERQKNMVAKSEETERIACMYRRLLSSKAKFEYFERKRSHLELNLNRLKKSQNSIDYCINKIYSEQNEQQSKYRYKKHSNKFYIIKESKKRMFSLEALDVAKKLLQEKKRS